MKLSRLPALPSWPFLPPQPTTLVATVLPPEPAQGRGRRRHRRAWESVETAPTPPYPPRGEGVGRRFLLGFTSQEHLRRDIQRCHIHSGTSPQPGEYVLCLAWAPRLMTPNQLGAKRLVELVGCLMSFWALLGSGILCCGALERWSVQKGDWM